MKRTVGAVAVAAGAVGADFARVPGDRAGARANAEPPKKYVLIIQDRSGSMAGVREVSVTALNSFFDEQRGDDSYISLAQFDSAGYPPELDFNVVFDFMPAKDVKPLTLEDYVPRGNTPLYAAGVAGIVSLEKILRPIDKALVIFQTDGGNTDIGEITADTLKDLKAAKEAEGNWTFVFLGADIDTWGVGVVAQGYAPGNSMSYHNNVAGTIASLSTVSAGTTAWSRSADRSTSSFFADAGQPDVSVDGSAIHATIDFDPLKIKVDNATAAVPVVTTAADSMKIKVDNVSAGAPSNVITTRIKKK